MGKEPTQRDPPACRGAFQFRGDTDVAEQMDIISSEIYASTAWSAPSSISPPVECAWTHSGAGTGSEIVDLARPRGGSIHVNVPLEACRRFVWIAIFLKQAMLNVVVNAIADA